MFGGQDQISIQRELEAPALSEAVDCGDDGLSADTAGHTAKASRRIDMVSADQVRLWPSGLLKSCPLLEVHTCRKRTITDAGKDSDRSFPVVQRCKRPDLML